MKHNITSQKYLFALLILTLPSCAKAPADRSPQAEAQEKYQPTSVFIFSDFAFYQPLKQLLQVTGVEHDNSWAAVVEGTQKKWLRRPGTERWQMDSRWEELRDTVLPLFDQLDLLDAVTPTQKQYDYAFILGALVSRVRTRLAYALELWQQGIRFDTLVFLVGARPLDPEKESKEILYDRANQQLPIKTDWQKPAQLPQTETDMARMVFEQAQLPKDFKENVKVVFVNTPMQLKPDGTHRRPNTADTINHWQPEKTSGNILAISNQPYVKYQHAVLKTYLPKTFDVETVGHAAGKNIHVGVMLDNIARWLYQEHKLRLTQQ